MGDEVEEVEEGEGEVDEEEKEGAAAKLDHFAEYES